MENAKYIIYYNPYRNVSSIKKNGNNLAKTSRLRKNIEGKRVQEWFDVTPSWRGFAAELAEDNRGHECRILFVGRKMDFDDFKHGIESFIESEHNTTVFDYELKELQSEEDMLKQLEVLVNEICASDMFSAAQKEELKEHICKLQEEPFKISVLATMSSGKSTLLNALLKTPLLPIGDDATTANIVEIIDNDDPDGNFSIEAYDKEGRLIDNRDKAGSEDFKEFNREDIRLIKVLGDIPMVKVGKMRLMLRDTPGPNNALTNYHKEVTDSIINDPNNMSVVMFVMDATKPSITDEKGLLERIAYEMKNGNKLVRDRFFFVINKTDQYVIKENQRLETLISNYRKLLAEEFGIANPRIFPIAAKLTSEIYELKNGGEIGSRRLRALNTDIENFSDESDDSIMFEKYSSTSVYVNEEIEEQLRRFHDENNEQGIAMIHTGIPSLELSIKEYVEKYAYPIKVSDAIENILLTIDQKEMENKFFGFISENENNLQAVRRQIERLEIKKGERTERRDAVKKEIGDYKIEDTILDKYKSEMNIAFQEAYDTTNEELSSDNIGIEGVKEKLKNFQNDLKTVEDRVREELDNTLKKNLYERGQETLRNYYNYVQSIRDEIGTIPGFNLNKHKIFKQDFYTLQDNVESMFDERDETKEVPDYTIKFDLFWIIPIRLGKYEKHVPTGRKIYSLKKEDFKNKYIEIKEKATTNIEGLYREAEENLNDFKQYFEEQINKLDALIMSITEELKKSTSEENIIKFKKRNIEAEQNRLNNIIKNISEITLGDNEYE